MARWRGIVGGRGARSAPVCVPRAVADEAATVLPKVALEVGALHEATVSVSDSPGLTPGLEQAGNAERPAKADVSRKNPPRCFAKAGRSQDLDSLAFASPYLRLPDTGAP